MPPTVSRHVRIGVLSFALGLVACGGDAGGRPASTPGAVAKPGVARVVIAPYRVAPLGAMGRVVGTVEVDGEMPRDSVVRLTGELAQQCGLTQIVPTVEGRASKMANVVVWLEGARSGKAMPLVRRYTLVQDGCLLRPRVMTAATGGSLAIVNDDHILHVTVVTREGAAQPIASVRMSFDGQVVPVYRALDEPGVLDLVCSIHPWGRAWVRVFDHPYFTTTRNDGSFAIDSIPPGRYAIVAWHERLGAMRDSVTVGEGGEVRVAFKGRAQ